MADAPVSKVPPTQLKRYTALDEVFKVKYGQSPAFYARAPGRVNLIGEHIDYCGYAVLPMAIEQDIVIACCPTDDNVIQLSNVNPDFQDFQCTTTDYNIDKSNPQWFHYFLCGFKGILEHMETSNSKGMQMMLDGIVPKSSGLSSSSAFVCCAALATMYANGHSLTKLELADVCMRCERYIGTQGGGMDQSISFLAQAGTAKLIEFNPIKAADVQLPDGAVFVVSNSRVEMQKAATSHFNIRVVECRLSCQIIAKSKGLDWMNIKKLGDLQTALGVSLEGMLTIVKDVLHEKPYTKEEICQILNSTEDDLNQNSLSQNTIQVQSFKLYQRATHVFGEANRVQKFKSICDGARNTEGADVKLGQLMNDSHISCRDMYECSCTELDRLVDLCRQSGALGSRLTGAGWGGCAVSMVPSNKVTDFINNVTAKYYCNESVATVNESLFATAPGSGAAIYI